MAETASKRVLVVDDASLVRLYYRDAWSAPASRSTRR